MIVMPPGKGFAMPLAKLFRCVRCCPIPCQDVPHTSVDERAAGPQEIVHTARCIMSIPFSRGQPQAELSPGAGARNAPYAFTSQKQQPPNVHVGQMQQVRRESRSITKQVTLILLHTPPMASSSSHTHPPVAKAHVHASDHHDEVAERPSRRSQLTTKYVNMLLALDKIPGLHNIFASFFVWILLAGFVLFPGTFTSLQNQAAVSGGAVGKVLNTVAHVPL